MALFEETEPPSSSDRSEQNKKLSAFFSKIKNYIKTFFKSLDHSNFFSNVADSFKNVVSKARLSFLFFKNLFVGKYLPHVALVAICLIVLMSNLNDRMVAKAYSNDLVEVNPDAEMEIIQQVDQYTPVIKGDANFVEKAIASSASDGFVSSTGNSETVITARVDPLPDNSSQQVNYTIRSGDTLSSLGMEFGVKLATLKYVNDMSNIDSIKPGATIKIPARGYEVSATLIAAKENAQNAKQLALASRNTVARDSRTTTPTVKQSAGSKVNGYPYGYCTYYVATRRQVPASWGDAKSWLGSAQRAGYATGSEATAGAIMVSSESWWGHVAYVESVDGDSMTISEMNYKGWGIISQRTISVHSGFIKGFVY